MMFNGEADCNKCSHKNVCGIKEMFKSTKRQVDDLEASILDKFEINFKCKEFREDNAVRTPYGK